METMRTIRNVLAWLAGAPLPLPSVDVQPSPQPRRTSALYASEPRKPAPPAPPPRRTTRQRDGDEGEREARRFLERAGLTFVAANVRYRDGELDLVMRDRPHAARAAPTLVFVEVRRRARTGHGGAAASVTRDKRRRLVAAAAHYLVGLEMRTLPPSRFDVVTLDGRAADGVRIEWIKDAFRDEG